MFMLAAADPHPAFFQTRKVRVFRRPTGIAPMCVAFGFLSLAAPICAFAQTAPAQQTAVAAEGKNTGSAPAFPRVTTTVVVHDDGKQGYLPEAVTVGSLDGATIKELPLAATVVTSELIHDQGSRLLFDVVKNDASIGNDYVSVGYYGVYAIRGIPIDLATSMQINGLTIAGEQDVPLENKESVEFLKGIAGIESGVTSAGGLIDFVTKRPAMVKAVDLATDHRGTAYGAVDLGHLFGSAKQVGARINLAGEKIQTYVNDADGWRAVGAGSADWKINSKAILKGDFEFQHKVERDESGYQLLGGTVVPDLHRIYTSNMLGEQSWLKPNTFDVCNSNVRLDYDLTHGWKAFAALSYSHSLIDDNVIYAYGNSVAGPDYFFAPDGTYDIYDYRNPGELRINAQAEAMVVGQVKTGTVTHNLAAGGVAFLRSFQQPGAAPADAPSTVQNGSVYTWIGSENIYEPNVAYPIENPLLSAGPRALNDDHHQSAAVVQDRMFLPGHVQLWAGGRYASVRDHNFGGDTTTDKKVWLPQYAATFSPSSKLTLYGNYSVMLSLGPQAPWWAGGFYLDPFYTRQSEVGAKFEPGRKILMTAALFRTRMPFFYPKVVDDEGNQEFVSEGHETHSGIELNAEGKATNWLRLTASATAMKADSEGTGTPSFDNKQIINAPHLRTNVFADVLLTHVRGLHLMPGWSYTGRKEATRDDTVSVSGYNLFNLGARYMPAGEQGHVALRIYADNIFNKRYWQDTGASYGDTFLWLGAPTTVRLSAHYTF